MLILDSTCPVNWQHPLNRGLAAWFLAGVQGRTGGAKWYDLVRNHQGVLTDMDPKTDWIGSKRLGSFGAIDLDGTNDRVLLPDAVSVRGQAAATVSVWYKPDATPAANAAVYYESTANAGANRFGLFHLQTTGVIRAQMRDTDAGTTFLAADSVALTTGQWHHLVMTVDASSERLVLYRGGVERALDTTAKNGFTTGLPADPISVGAYITSTFVDGQVDDVRVWHRALSAQEVRAYYDLSRQGYPGLLNRIRDKRIVAFVPASIFTGSAAVTTGGATGEASAEFTAPVYDGSVAATTGGATAAVDAEVTNPTYTGEVAATLSGVTSVSTATFGTVFSGSVAATIGGVTAIATASDELLHTAVGNVTFGKATVAAVAEHYEIVLIPNSNASGNVQMASANFTAIDEDPLALDGQVARTNPGLNTGVSARANFGLSDTPADFHTMNSVAVFIASAINESPLIDDVYTTYVQVFESDGVTPLTNEVQVRQFTSADGLNFYRDVVTLTGVEAADKTTWDGAILRWRCESVRTDTADGARGSIMAMRLIASYDVAAVTGSVAATIGGATAAASVTLTNPTYTGSTTPTTSGMTCSGTATFTSSTSTGEAEPVAAGMTCSGTATFTAPLFDSDVVVTTGGTSSVSTAVFTAPVYTATAACLAGGATTSIDADFLPLGGSADVTTGGVIGVAAGTITPPIYQPDVIVTTGSVVGVAAASFTAPVWTGDTAVTVAGARATIAAAVTNPTYSAETALAIGSVAAVATATVSAPVITGTAFPRVRNIRGTSSASFSPQARTGSAAVTTGGARGLASSTTTAPSGNFAHLTIPAMICSAAASFTPRYVPIIANRNTSGIANRTTSAIAAATSAGHINKPWYDDHGAVHLPEDHGVTVSVTTGGAFCTAAGVITPPTGAAIAAVTAGGATTAVDATFTAPVYDGTAELVLGPPWMAAIATFAAPTIDATVAVSTSGMASSGTATFAGPGFEGSAAVVTGGTEAAAAATFTPGTVTGTVAATVKAARTSVSATASGPVFTATAAMALHSVRGVANATNVEDTFIASVAPVSSGLTCSGTATFTFPTYTGSAAVETSGATAIASASHQVPVRTATAVADVGYTVFSATATVIPPVSVDGTAALTTAGATAAAAAIFTPQLRTAVVVVTAGRVRSASSASFTTTPSGTTPLSQPHWLEWTENYPYAKPGVAYDSVTYETILTENNVLVAVGSADLQNKINQAKSSSSIDAIWVDPAANPYTLGNNPFTGLSRPLNRPLVIRTLPGSSIQADLQSILQSQTYNGLALVDLKFEDCRLVGAGQNTLIEKCVGWFDLQGTRAGVNNPVDPMVNTHFRLNVCVDHWAPGSNILVHGLYFFHQDGILLEGNLWDHNGWRPDGDRSTDPSIGGPTQQKHNVYNTRPNANVYFRYNVTSRASSHGFHNKGGGHTRRNLLVRNPLSQHGYGGDGTFGAFGNVIGGSWKDNLTLDADDIATGQSRGIQLWITCSDGLLVEGNYAIENTTSTSGNAFCWLERNFEILNLQIKDNIAYSWPGTAIVLSASGTFTPQYTTVNNNFNAATFQGSAKALADQLKSDSYLDTIKVSRKRLGMDILQLQSDMDFIRAGVS